MLIKELEIVNFRNYEREYISFSPNLNVIVGKNAQGKTNLIESVYLLATGTSPRATFDREMINMSAEQARLRARVGYDEGDREIEMVLSRKEKKRCRINDLPISRIGELMGNLNIVFFSPDELRLIKDSPEYRRKFIDIDLCQLSRAYFYTLNKYNKVLRQRNTLLKSERKADILATLAIWDTQLAHEGAKIIEQRKAFCKNLSERAKEIHFELTGGIEELVITYQTTVESENRAEMEQELISQLQKNTERDLRLGFTSVGAQRDDLKIALSGIDVRTYGSQGQQRTATLSMKLAEIDVFESVTREKPILLLDDVLSELDFGRQERLLQKASALQTLITTTNSENINYSGKIFEIKNGQVLSEITR